MTTIQFRRDTAHNLETINPVLMDGEPCVDLTNGTLKIGDGTTAYNDLKKISGGGGTGKALLEIYIDPFIDESKNEGRIANGQIIIQDQFPGAVSKLKRVVGWDSENQAATLRPQMVMSEEEWQATKTLSALGQVAAYVINDEAGTVRLPAIKNIQGVYDLAEAGGLVEQSLPNIKGTFNTGDRRTHASGTDFFYPTTTPDSSTYSGQVTAKTNEAFGANASRCSSAYRDGAPVQEEACLYPYVICVNSAVEEAERPINNYTVANPYSYGDSKYYRGKLNNACFLKSAGQWNSGAVYNGTYEWIVQTYNSAEVVFDEGKISVVGALSNNNGIISGFSAANYIKVPASSVPEFSSFESCVKFTTGSDVTATQTPFVFLESSTGLGGIWVEIKEGYLKLYLSGNGTSYDKANNLNIQAVEPNTTYIVKYIWDGESFVVEVNGEVKTTIEAVTAIAVPGADITLGGRIKYTGEYFRGSVDLNECYIKLNGEMWWLPLKKDCDIRKSTESYSDYDFVFNSDDMTFRLPLLNGSEHLPDWDNEEPREANTIYIAERNGYFIGALMTGADGSKTYVKINNTIVGVDKTVGQYADDNNLFCIFVKRGDKYQLFSTGDKGPRSFVSAIGNGNLYYYIGNVEQNVDLVNIARMQEELVDLKAPARSYLIKSYKNGLSGYRIYSDGWCEQWGQYEISNSSKTINVSLFIPFVDTNYHLQPGRSVNTSDHIPSWLATCFAKLVTNSGFVSCYDSQEGRAASTNMRWCAKGYVDLGSLEV